MYVEQDIRQIFNIHDLSAFRRFLELCADRMGQVLNISSLQLATHYLYGGILNFLLNMNY